MTMVPEDCHRCAYALDLGCEVERLRKIMEQGTEWREGYAYGVSVNPDVVRLREALEALSFYLRQPHQKLGEACGVDACVLCLAESTAATALASRTTQGSEER